MSETSSERTTATTGELVGQLSEQTTRLLRDELRLAQAELSQKAKKAGTGAGLFGAAGLFGLLGLGTLVATAVLALDNVMPAWLAALIVALILLAVAGVAALLGKKKVSQATPMAPQRTLDNVKKDVQEVKEARAHDQH